MEQLYQRILDAAEESVILVDRDGVVKHCNSMAARLMGRPAEALIGHDGAGIVPDEIRQHRHKMIGRVFESGEAMLDEDEWDGVQFRIL